MNGENRPIGPAPLPDNSPPGPPIGGGGPPTPPPRPAGPPPPLTGGLPSGPPPPPPPQIDIRTMASDAESLKATGGLGAQSKTFSPADLAKEPVFTSEITSPAGAPKAGASGKKLGLAAGAVAVLALAAAVGYYFVWPLFSGEETPQVTEITPPPTLPTETPTSPAPALQGLFTKPAASTKEVSLNALTLAELSSALRTKSGEAAATGTIKEIILKVNGTSATSSALLNVLVPGTGLESMLDPLATSFVYYDAKGAWPGYVFKLKSGTSPAAAQTSTAKIEQSANLAALYLTSPGTASKNGFKSGSAAAVSTRYLSFSSGASLNYGWVGNYLVISTSFDGFKKAIELLPPQ